jgi:hypothetical protein
MCYIYSYFFQKNVKKLVWKDGTKQEGNFENGSLEFTPFQKKMQQTTMKAFGRITGCQEKESLSGKMEGNMRDMSLNINQSILKLCFWHFIYCVSNCKDY